jgi:hypothetical protein
MIVKNGNNGWGVIKSYMDPVSGVLHGESDIIRAACKLPTYIIKKISFTGPK